MNELRITKIFENDTIYQATLDIKLIKQNTGLVYNKQKSLSLNISIQKESGKPLESFNAKSTEASRKYISTYFPEYSYLLEWVDWSIEGPIHYSYVEYILNLTKAVTLQPAEYKYFLTIAGIPLLYKIEQSLYDYITKEGIDKIKSDKVVEFNHPDNGNIRKLYSIGNCTKTWKDAPFTSRVEAEAFLETILSLNNIEVKQLLTKKEDLKSNVLKRIELLSKLKESDVKLYTKEILQQQLKLCTKKFKSIIRKLGLKP